MFVIIIMYTVEYRRYCKRNFQFSVSGPTAAQILYHAISDMIYHCSKRGRDERQGMKSG